MILSGFSTYMVDFGALAPSFENMNEYKNIFIVSDWTQICFRLEEGASRDEDVKQRAEFDLLI